MFTIERRTICERDLDYFLSDPHTNVVIEEAGISEKETSDLLHTISEKGDWIIDSILSEQIKEIDNKKIRNWFRRFLISEKYNILMDYPRGGTKKYCIMFADDKCVFVQSPRVIRDNEIIKPTSTIVLSPQGNVLVPENTVYIYENSITKHGFTASWNDLYGLYTRNGEMLLPCIFERIEHKNYENYIFLRYKGIYFMMQYWVDEFSANYRYNDMVLSFDPIEYLMSFLSETKEYKKPKEELDYIIAENSKKLFGILDTLFHRLNEEEIRREEEIFDSKLREE